MDPISVLKILHMTVGTAQKLKQILEDDLPNTLTAIGDVNFTAAGKALQDIKLSDRPRREIESAITHLRAAYIALNSIPRPTSKEYVKCVSALCTIATCYKHLGERKLQRDYLAMSEDIMAKWNKGIAQDEEKRRILAYTDRGFGKIILYYMDRKYFFGYEEAYTVWQKFLRSAESV